MNSEFFILAGIVIAACAAVANIFGASPNVLNEKKDAMVSDFEETCAQNYNSENKSHNVLKFISEYGEISKYHDYRIDVLMGLLGLAAMFIVCGFSEEISIASNVSTYVVTVMLIIFAAIILIVRILPSLWGLMRISK